MKKIAIAIVFLLGAGEAFSQELKTTHNGEIVTFVPIYATGYVDMPAGYMDGSTFLLTSDKPENFDSIFFLIRKFNFSIQSQIVDTLSHYFDVYEITTFPNDTAKNANHVYSLLHNTSNYGRLYIFEPTNPAVKRNAVASYMMMRYTNRKPIQYEIFRQAKPLSGNYPRVKIHKIGDRP